MLVDEEPVPELTLEEKEIFNEIKDGELIASLFNEVA